MIRDLHEDALKVTRLSPESADSNIVGHKFCKQHRLSVFSAVESHDDIVSLHRDGLDLRLRRRNFTASQTFSTTWIRIGLESFTFFKISPMFPDRTTFPASMIPISVHIWASSERMWELTTMVFPQRRVPLKAP